MSNTILIIGGDGYLGWPLAMRIAVKNPNKQVVIIDNNSRRRWVKEVGGKSLTHIASPEQRSKAFSDQFSQQNLQFIEHDAADPVAMESVFQSYMPGLVYHLAHQPSAPYSMHKLEAALETIRNNELNCINILWQMRQHTPKAHLIKMGTFGAYSNCGLDIPEGNFHPSFRNQVASTATMFPREADDLYHISKINDSHFISMACRKWNLKVTDVAQSTIFGCATRETLSHSHLQTRFDYDSYFGTVLNRFIAQMLSKQALSVYGSGEQKTGISVLADTVQVLSLLGEQEPNPGTHRMINNVIRHYSVNELASIVANVGQSFGYQVEIERGKFDPRQEGGDDRGQMRIDTPFLDQNITPQPLEEAVASAVEILAPLSAEISVDRFPPQNL